MHKRLTGGVLLASLGLAGAASAHHSGAMYDPQIKTTLVGTVSEFEWANPHAWVHLEVRDPASHKTTNWVFESLGVNQLTRAGWKRDSLKAGDKAEIVFNPLRDGKPGGRVVSVNVGGKLIGVKPEQTP